MVQVYRGDELRIALPHHYHVNEWLAARNNQRPFIPMHSASKAYDMKLIKYVVTYERRDEWLSEHEGMWRELSVRCSLLLSHLVYILFPEVTFLRNMLSRACCKPGSFRYGEVTCANGLTHRLHVPSEFFLLFWLERHANEKVTGSAHRWANTPRSLVDSFCGALEPLQRFAFKFIFDADQLLESTIKICIGPLLEITRCATAVINNLLAHVVYVQDMVTQVELRCPCDALIENEYLFGVYLQSAATATSAGEDALPIRIVYACPHLARRHGKHGYTYIVIIDESGKAVGGVKVEASNSPFDTGEGEEEGNGGGGEPGEEEVNKKVKQKQERRAKAKTNAESTTKKKVVDYEARSVLVASIKEKLSQIHTRVRGE